MNFKNIFGTTKILTLYSLLWRHMFGYFRHIFYYQQELKSMFSFFDFMFQTPFFGLFSSSSKQRSAPNDLIRSCLLIFSRSANAL